MRTVTVTTSRVLIYMSGPIDVAKQVLREECMERGLCVTIDKTAFIYTGGEENGYVIGMLNYPRFPCESSALFDRAVSIATRLINETHQHSGLVVSDDYTIWITRRPEQ